MEVLTFVTLVPAKKNTISSANGRFHGCTAWAIAVRVAATMPAGVRDLCDQARYTSASVAGTASIGFILDLNLKLLMSGRCSLRRQTKRSCRESGSARRLLREHRHRPHATSNALSFGINKENINNLNFVLQM